MNNIELNQLTQFTLKLSENLSIQVEKKSQQFGHDHETKLGDYPKTMQFLICLVKNCSTLCLNL